MNGQNPNNGQCQLLARMLSNRNSHFLLVGMQNEAIILKDNFVVSYKAKKKNLAMASGNHAPMHLLNLF